MPSEVGGVMLNQYDQISKEFKRCETKEDLECVEEVTENYTTCDCRPECDDVVYQVIPSMRLF
jgi:hypothetical protein